MSKKLIVYGDQTITSPGPYDNFNVKQGEHWWELLAEELGLTPELLEGPFTSHSVSPLYYASIIINSNIDDNFFISVVPSSHRSLNWDNRGPIHNTDDHGPQIIDDYCKWQSNFVYNILDQWSKDKRCLFFVQENRNISTDKLFIIPYLKRGEIPQFWGWVMEQHPDLTNVGSFFRDCTNDRKLNAYGHKCVYDVVRKHI